MRSVRHGFTVLEAAVWFGRWPSRVVGKCRGRPGCGPGLIAAALLVIAVVGLALAGVAYADDSVTSAAVQPKLDEQLGALHKEAAAARGAKQFAEVERLRLRRRKLISESQEGSFWTKGIKAAAEAQQAVNLMQYDRACRLLEAAWKPFDALPPRRVVFGDLAMQLFLASEAARMVDPDAVLVPADTLRQCLERAAADDPCQVEAEAALAFMARPAAEESFLRQNERESIRLRNKRLLSIGRDPDQGGSILPWHAAVQYLRAKSTEFVLGDTRYLRTFLNPDARLSGSNRHGESWCLTLGGGILGTTTERAGGQVREVVKIDSYDTRGRTWRELRPQILVVAAAVPDADAGVWGVAESAIQKRLGILMIDLEAEAKRAADAKLVAIAGRFPPEVVAAVEQIRNGTWVRGPAPGSPIEDVLRVADNEFGTYAANRPDQAVAALKAQRDIKSMLEELSLVSRIKVTASTSLPPDADLPLVQQMIDGMEFPESRMESEDPLAVAGFGAARQQRGRQGPQLKVELLDMLARAELLAAMRAYREDGNGLSLIKSVRDQAKAQLELAAADAAPAQRHANRLLDNAASRLEAIFAKSTPAVPPAAPLSLADFIAVRTHLDEVRFACAMLDLPDGERLGERMVPMLEVYDRVVGPVKDRAHALRVAAGKPAVRSWTIGAVDWKFFELGSIGAMDAAALVDIFPPLVLAAGNLEAVSKHLAEGGVNPPAPACGPGSAATGPLVDSSGRAPRLRIAIAPPANPIVMIVLVERERGSAAGGPRTLVDDKGRSMLLLDDAGTSRPMRLDLEAGSMVVEFPGLEGHVQLGIAADAAAAPRFLKDRRGYRISAAAADQPRLFDIVAANGERVDGNFHSIPDLVDLDRNIVNEFLPPVLLYSPSLPAWQVYRAQLLLQPPDARVRWAVPRPAFLD